MQKTKAFNTVSAGNTVSDKKDPLSVRWLTGKELTVILYAAYADGIILFLCALKNSDPGNSGGFQRDSRFLPVDQMDRALQDIVCIQMDLDPCIVGAGYR